MSRQHGDSNPPKVPENTGEYPTNATVVAPPCPHGSAFVTLCPTCTPPLEKEEGAQCDDLMSKLGWRTVSFSQPFKATQTKGISDRRYYPPEWNPHGHVPFWHEQKRIKGKTNKETKKGQAAFQALVESAGEPYVRGGLKELAEYLRENRIAEVGIR
jgi:hypothetical protein